MTTDYTPNFGLALPDFRQGPWHDLVNSNMTKLDQIVFGALSSADTPVWDNNVHYTTGITAFDSDDATTWMNTIDHTSAATGSFADERTAHPTYWTQLLVGFAPRGEWQNSTNYFPYDLAYQGNKGVLALCKTKHTSNASGSILDDASLWTFLVDFSTISAAQAIAVTYDSSASGLGVSNVQAAIDKLETQIVALNNVNITQGNQITTLQNQDTSDNTRMTNIESKNTTQDTQITNINTSITTINGQISAINTSLAGKVDLAGNNQVQPGGYSVISKSWGNMSGAFTPNPVNGNYQYGNNVGAFTFNALAAEGGIDFLISNGAGAGTISFSGYTVNTGNIGDALDTVNGHRFIISLRRIATISMYSIRALQ